MSIIVGILARATFSVSSQISTVGILSRALLSASQHSTMFSASFLPLLFSVALIPNASAQRKFADVEAEDDRIYLALPALQTWYNGSTSLWETTGWWNAANILTMIDGFIQYDDYADNPVAKPLARNLSAIAFKSASAMNPQRGIPYSSAPFHQMAICGYPYAKHLDPITNEPHTSLPPDWYIPSNSTINTTTPLLDYPTSVNANDWLDGYSDDNL
jgi:hypothetical protein